MTFWASTINSAWGFELKSQKWHQHIVHWHACKKEARFRKMGESSFRGIQMYWSLLASIAGLSRVLHAPSSVECRHYARAYRHFFLCGPPQLHYQLIPASSRYKEGLLMIELSLCFISVFLSHESVMWFYNNCLVSKTVQKMSNNKTPFLPRKGQFCWLAYSQWIYLFSHSLIIVTVWRL